MNLRSLIILFCVMVTIDANGINNLEMIGSLTRVKCEAVKAQRKMTQNSDNILFSSLMIYALDIAIEHLDEVMNMCSKQEFQREASFDTFDAILTKMQTDPCVNDLSPKAQPLLTASLKETHRKQLAKGLPSTRSNIISMFFDLHKKVIRDLGLQWGFDTANVYFY